MESTWELLKKELLFYGIDIIDETQCTFTDGKKAKQTFNILDLIEKFKTQINNEKDSFKFLWKELQELLQTGHDFQNLKAVDYRLSKLFINSLKELNKFIDAFKELDNSDLKNILLYQLSKDINEFSAYQIKIVPEYKIAIDVTFRNIQKLNYLVKLLRISTGGKNHVNTFLIKTAQAALGGPWSNLDIPVDTRHPGEGRSERIWKWEEEDENLLSRDGDLKKQERYTLGLENYNNDGRVGEGFYAREIKNEPFNWDDRDSEDPYPSRHTLSRD